MFRKKIILSLLSLLAISATAASRSPESVAQEIIAFSPRLKTLAAESEAGRAKGSTEANLPDPEIEGEFLAAPPGEQNRWGAGISWGLDWPGVYSARKQLAKADAETGRLRLEVEKRDLSIETRRLLLDYILQSRQIEVVEGILQSTDSITALAAKARDGGEMTLLDVNKIRIEAASLSSRLLSMQDARRQTVNSLSLIAGQDCSPLLSEMETVLPQSTLIPEDKLDNLLATSPQMLEARSAIEAAETERKVAAREALPSISFGYRHAFEDGNHFNGGSVGFSLPLFSSRGKLKAAQANRKAAEIAAEEIRLTSENTATAALQRRNALNKEISTIAPLIENTDNQALLLKAYSNGVITLIDYLNERNYFLEATLQLLELRHAAANSDLDLLSILPL